MRDHIPVTTGPSALWLPAILPHPELRNAWLPVGRGAPSIRSALIVLILSG